MAELIPYAVRTGTRRNLDGLRARGWRLLVSAAGAHRTEGFPYAIDNGAWTAYQQQQPIDLVKFGKLLDKLGAGADWIALPDIVAGGLKSLDLSMEWKDRVLAVNPMVLLPVQNGMTVRDVEGIVCPQVGIFVGGDDVFKLSMMAEWADFARAKGAWCHIARVNTVKRIRKCALAGATSFDGKAASMYLVEQPKLQRARLQQFFILGGGSK